MNSLRNIAKIARMSAQQPVRYQQTLKIKTSEHLVEEIKSTDPDFIKFKERQAKFQVDDGVPVHLKGGFTDKVLYYFTMSLCVIGVGFTVDYFWKSAQPTKN